MALLNHLAQYLLDSPQLVDFLTHVPQLVLGQSAGLLAVSAIFKL